MVESVLFCEVPPELVEGGVEGVGHGVVPFVEKGDELVALFADLLVREIGEFGFAVDEEKVLEDFAGLRVVLDAADLL